jgi:SPP1 gp7 family putative phage head morphogenesis protein
MLTWFRHRLDNIFRTNIQGCYNRGRWERFVAVKDEQLYLMYDAINDNRVRPAHLAMDNIIRPVDDAFWVQHAPPNGYRCRVISLSADQAKARSGQNTDNQKYFGPDGEELPQA